MATTIEHDDVKSVGQSRRGPGPAQTVVRETMSQQQRRFSATGAVKGNWSPGRLQSIRSPGTDIDDG